MVWPFKKKSGASSLPEKTTPPAVKGTTRHSDNQHIESMRAAMQPNLELRAVIRTMREWDKKDPRVKKVHNRMARDTVRGGLILEFDGKQHAQVQKVFETWRKTLGLQDVKKLKSDARQFAVQGNLALQWVLDEKSEQVVAGVSMPVDTLWVNSTDAGQLADLQTAYVQKDFITGKPLASFAAWQMTIGRLDPDNYDDHGCLGRPYLDACQKALLQLEMTEEDLVVRRRTRAPSRTLYTFEGADEKILDKYRDEFDRRAQDVTANYYANHKAAAVSVDGDANMDQIGDVLHLMNTFFSGAPAPKGLFGYVEDLNRDILEDLKKDYYEEIDELQDSLSAIYQKGFELHLLLQGLDPDRYGFQVKFAERRTETRNQKADLALKYQSMGFSDDTVMRTAGVDPAAEKARIEDQRKQKQPYLEHGDSDPRGEHDSNTGRSVTITEGNAKKGESATDMSNG